MVAKDKLRLVELLNSGEPEKVADTLLYIAHNINDVEWAEEQFMRMANNPDEDISELALTCLGHIARINGRINKDVVIPFLEEKMKNSSELISSRAEDALDDINMFT
ncbi:MAG: hypothetical protein E6X23_05020 [Mixta calida]|uniref:hypothetical protein n=1 Tax=Mixta calida TaxID=665913 RepID=UPI0005360C33|nr:hypothetical protein [Mixta calida]AIX73176.1 hypothetical protein PSNIH2_04905 [Pantoea sp. PSNIH2]MBS6057073.1 hypothetical protein [Pantoea sp.]POU42824.1 hypothetical protein C3380_21275 [Pantoea sp. PSNIH5]POU60408.1 hypothetical protein C3374_21210 [Pantoea sp. PSNIH4]POY65328.1 hypothetical protein C3402_24060 [Pantoea sp. PSNIH3]